MSNHDGNHNTTGGNTSPATSSLSFAQALTDARALIVQQSNRIKADAERIRQQAEEIAQARREIERLRPHAARARELEAESAQLRTARDTAQAEAHRLQQQVEQLEIATEDLQCVVRGHEEKNSALAREVEKLRGRIPSEADATALAALNALLQTARKNGKGDEARHQQQQVRQAA